MTLVGSKKAFVITYILLGVRYSVVRYNEC